MTGKLLVNVSDLTPSERTRLLQRSFSPTDPSVWNTDLGWGIIRMVAVVLSFLRGNGHNAPDRTEERAREASRQARRKPLVLR